MRRRKRLRRKEIRKRRIIVITALFSVTFLLASGYAAFSTNLNINAKGNLLEKENTTIGGKKVYLATSGDGLYADPLENNRYVYKGANPDNYICLEIGSGTCSEGNLYRIIAKEADGSIKVIKNKAVSSITRDPGYSTNINGITSTSSIAGTRYSNINTDYCYVSDETQYNGCNVWGNNDSTYDSTGNTKVTSVVREVNSNTTYNLPVYNSYQNVFLNGGTYPTTNGTTTITGWIEGQNSIITNNIVENHIFNIGSLNLDSSQTLSTDIFQEKTYTWKGKVGLMNATDYVRASTNSSCTGVYAYKNISNCYNNSSSHNWLFNSYYQYTLSQQFSASSVHLVHVDGKFYGNYSHAQVPFRPTFFLKSNISISGKGTNDSNVYRIA